MLVGEGPGREEDLSGKPFVGRGGKLLNSVLESVSMPRETVFVTNIVKCRPPGNRVPTRAESATCVGAYLWRQLEAIGPDIVVLMGLTAARSVLGAKSLSEVRGKWKRRGNRRFICTYHPAAALRNPGLVATLRADLKRARKALD